MWFCCVKWKLLPCNALEYLMWLIYLALKRGSVEQIKLWVFTVHRCSSGEPCLVINSRWLAVSFPLHIPICTARASAPELAELQPAGICLSPGSCLCLCIWWPSGQLLVPLSRPWPVTSKALKLSINASNAGILVFEPTASLPPIYNVHLNTSGKIQWSQSLVLLQPN